MGFLRAPPVGTEDRAIGRCDGLPACRRRRCGSFFQTACIREAILHLWSCPCALGAHQRRSLANPDPAAHPQPLRFEESPGFGQVPFGIQVCHGQPRQPTHHAAGLRRRALGTETGPRLHLSSRKAAANSPAAWPPCPVGWLMFGPSPGLQYLPPSGVDAWHLGPWSLGGVRCPVAWGQRPYWPRPSAWKSLEV